MKRIAIVGTRGVPAKYGGYETFAEEFLRFSQGKFPITVICERSSAPLHKYYESPLIYLSLLKSDNQLLYYWRSIYAALKTNDIILITGPGAGLFLPIFRLFWSKKTFITNPDGLEFRRSKWSLPVRSLLWILSWASVIFSNRVVADSVGISNYYLARLPFLRRKMSVIEYGSRVFPFLDSYESDYYLLVARFVPENNIEMIINGFLLSESKRTLKIVSDLPNTDYMKKVLRALGNTVRIELVGPEYDKERLVALRCKAFAHIHGHSVGGTNPSLLEAMSAGAPVIAHDNIFNRDVLKTDGIFFESDIQLSVVINTLEKVPKNGHSELSKHNRNRIKDYFNWERIFNSYIEVFEND